jgi:hypothetical protein
MQSASSIVVKPDAETIDFKYFLASHSRAAFDCFQKLKLTQNPDEQKALTTAMEQSKLILKNFAHGGYPTGQFELALYNSLVASVLLDSDPEKQQKIANRDSWLDALAVNEFHIKANTRLEASAQLESKANSDHSQASNNAQNDLNMVLFKLHQLKDILVPPSICSANIPGKCFFAWSNNFPQHIKIFKQLNDELVQLLEKQKALDAYKCALKDLYLNNTIPLYHFFTAHPDILQFFQNALKNQLVEIEKIYQQYLKITAAQLKQTLLPIPIIPRVTQELKKVAPANAANQSTQIIELHLRKNGNLEKLITNRAEFESACAELKIPLGSSNESGGNQPIQLNKIAETISKKRKLGVFKSVPEEHEKEPAAKRQKTDVSKETISQNRL